MRLLFLFTLPLAAQSYLLTTIAGSDRGIHDNLLATNAHLSWPKAIVGDKTGNYYVAEGNRVLRVGTDGRVQTVAGNGLRGDSPAEGRATLVPVTPTDLAVDAQGVIYILEGLDGRIRKLTPDGTIRTIIDIGRDSSGLYSIAVAPDGTLFWGGDKNVQKRLPNGGSETIQFAGQYYRPTALATDGAGNLYVYLPELNELHRIDPAGKRTMRPFRIGSPYEFAVDAAGNFYYTAPDGKSTQRMDSQGGIIQFPATQFFAPNEQGGILALADGVIVNMQASGTRTIFAGGGFGDGGPGYAANLNGLDLVTDRAGNIYFADSGNNRIRKINTSGVVSTIAVGFEYPCGIAIDSAENLYVADRDGHQIMKINPAGQVTVIAGTGQPGFSGDGGPAVRAEFTYPRDVAVDGTGAVYIADGGNHRVRKISIDGTLTTVMGPDGLREPTALVVDKQGNLFVSDVYGAKVLKRTPAGVVTAVLEDFLVPGGIAIDGAGNLYVGQQVVHRIWKVAPGGKPVPIAGTGIQGGGNDNGLATQAQLLGPAGMTFDPMGNLLFADYRCCDNSYIRKLEVANLFPRAIVNAATFGYAPIAPGEILTVYWTDVPPQNAKILFDGIAAPILFASTRQANVVVPFEVAGREVVTMRAESAAGPTNTLFLRAQPAAPGLFSPILNQNGSLNSPGNRALAGEYITAFGTGCGQTSPGGKTGAIATAELKRVSQSVSATIGGQPLDVSYSGSSPGLIEGVCQINLRMPFNIIFEATLPMVISVGGIPAPPILIWIGGR